MINKHIKFLLALNTIYQKDEEHTIHHNFNHIDLLLHVPKQDMKGVIKCFQFVIEAMTDDACNHITSSNYNNN